MSWYMRGSSGGPNMPFSGCTVGLITQRLKGRLGALRCGCENASLTGCEMVEMHGFRVQQKDCTMHQWFWCLPGMGEQESTPVMVYQKNGPQILRKGTLLCTNVTHIVTLPFICHVQSPLIILNLNHPSSSCHPPIPTYNIYIYIYDPPVNSGGALVPPHFIDINRGGTGPPCKATSIEWRCTGFFWHHFLYRIVGHECTLGNCFFLKYTSIEY